MEMLALWERELVPRVLAIVLFLHVNSCSEPLYIPLRAMGLSFFVLATVRRGREGPVARQENKPQP
jgi:hypothetical protein